MEALLPLIITFGLMWALLIRPQQRRVREHQQLVATLSAGDEVITTGGIVGTIVSVVDDIVTLEVSPGTPIKVLRAAIQTRIASDAADDGYVTDDSDLGEGGFDEYDSLLDPEPPDAAPRAIEVDDLTLTTLPTVSPNPTPPPPPPAPPTPNQPPTPEPPSTGEKA